MRSLLKSIVIKILTWEAKLVLSKYTPKIAAVTGSVGKTSTKDAIAKVLSVQFNVRKSEKSYNSEIGIPLTILGCRSGWNNPFTWFGNIISGLVLFLLPHSYPEWLVLEVGADRPGDIRDITLWLKPDIAIVTRIPKIPVHVEFFKSPGEITIEKGFLVQALKRDGILVLNGDDEEVRAFRSLTESAVLFYGTKNADIVGTDYKINYENKAPVGFSSVITFGKDIETFFVKGALGYQHLYPILASVAVGVSQKISFKKMLRAISQMQTPPGRMKIIKGIKNTVIIDDTYNSSPVALEEALNTLKSIDTSGRKIAVIGDMLELGLYSSEEHKKAGDQCARSADLLLTVGIRARGVAEGALNAGMSETNIFQYENAQTAGKELELMLKEGDVVLVKGSQGARMEKAVEEIMAEPERKEELLVRQDEEWKER